MAINSVSYGSTILNQSFLNLHDQLTTLQSQLTTGKKSTSYAGMGVNEGFAIAARSQLANISAFSDTMSNINTNIGVANTVLQSMVDTWKDLAAGATITVAQRINMRMASTNAIHKAREAVDFAYNAAGATAIFEDHPLERRFRDMHTVTQQLQGQIRHFETVGAWMLGAEADLTFV